MRQLEPGAVVAGYRIESLVGRGGMGVVYRAVQLGLDRIVALKVIAPELLDEKDVRERFLREARTAASVDHPNVIPVHEAGEEDGLAYIAMRFVAGNDLRSLVRRGGALDPAEASGYLEQAGAGLDAIHRAGFVHRDVKPANLLVDPGGHVYLTDFGLAKQVLTHSGDTRTGHWVGTLDYVAPEQIRGGRIDARADVYALGGVLYFAVTGRVPFERQGDEAKMWAQLSAPPPVPSARRRSLRPEFDAVVARAMAKHAEERYPSAGDLGRAARAAVEGTVPTEPERVVARGAAAPDGGETEPGIVAEASTRTALSSPEAPPRIARLPAALIGGGMIALAIAAVAVALILQPEKDTSRAALSTPAPTPTATPTATRTPLPYTLKVTRGVGTRPNGLALAGGDVWVTSAQSEWIARVSARTGRKRSRKVKAGFDIRAIVAYRDAIWVVVGSTNQVLEFDGRTGALRQRISVPRTPVRLAVERAAVWVATNWDPLGAGLLLRYDRRTGKQLQQLRVGAGVEAMTFAFGALWIATHRTHVVARLEPGSSTLEPWADLHRRPHAMRAGAGRVWVTYEGGIALINPRIHGPQFDDLGTRPAHSAVAGRRVYLASRGTGRVLVLSPVSLKLVLSIPVGVNPYAMATDGRSVWVATVGDDSLTRITPRQPT